MFSPKTGTRLYLVSRMMRRSSATVWSAAMATTSGRGVITCRTRVSENLARLSTSRFSSVSRAGGGGTSRVARLAGLLSSERGGGPPAARWRSQATSPRSVCA